jgi:hypothetical protein
MLKPKFESDRITSLFCEFLLYSLKAGDLDVHKVNPVKWWRPEAVLSAIHSCDVRLVVKSQSGLQIASSIRIMPQHSYLYVFASVKH